MGRVRVTPAAFAWGLLVFGSACGVTGAWLEFGPGYALLLAFVLCVAGGLFLVDVDKPQRRPSRDRSS